ncbi:MAG: cytochrome P450 [Bacteriovorax sp.]|nr:cytochrome P450 [Bacteriovorax sp.]
MDENLPDKRIAVCPPKDRFFGFITGHALSLRKSRLNFMYDSFLIYGDFLEMFLGKRRTLLVNDPAGLKYVLFDNAKNYPKNTPGYQRVAEVIGQGVFTDIGDEWRKGRRAIQPIFNPSKFDHYFGLILEESDKTLSKMLEEKDEEFNMSYWSTRYALHVIGRSLLNESLEDSFDIISQKLSKLIDLTEKKMTAILPFKTPSKKRDEKEFSETLHILDTEIQKIIDREKEKSRTSGGNFIHALLDSPENFTEQKILSQVKTMIFAGHETSANVITWGFYFLMKFPEWQDKIFSELKECNFEITSEEQVKKFKYVNLFLNEVLRKRPPAWSFGRVAVSDDMIHGSHVKAGDLISISPYLVQHHPDYWENPEEFNPNRFEKPPLPMTFIPYGAGQRVCMGERLANLEIAMIYLKTVEKFKLQFTEEEFEMPMNPQVSLRTEKTLMARMVKR